MSYRLAERKKKNKYCILSPCSWNFYAEYIVQNAGLDESQAEIKILQRNINNLIHADDTTLRQKMKRKQ